MTRTQRERPEAPANRTLLRLLNGLLNWPLQSRDGVAFLDIAFTPYGAVWGVCLVLTDAALRVQAIHVILADRMTRRHRQEVQRARTLAAPVPVFIQETTSRGLLASVLELLRGRLPVSHELGRDLSALRTLARQHGLESPVPPAWPGLDTFRLERAAFRRGVDLASSARRRGLPWMVKCLLSDALRTMAIARSHASTLAGLKRLTAAQMAFRVARRRQRGELPADGSETPARKKADVRPAGGRRRSSSSFAA